MSLAALDIAVSALGNPAGAIYLVALPSNVTTTPFTGNNCAVHAIDPNTGVAFAELPYQTAGLAAGCGWGNIGASTISNAFHELAEAVTDYSGGWYDSSESEIADACSGYPSTMGVIASGTLNSGVLVGQKLWSNDNDACVTTYTNDFHGGNVDSSADARVTVGTFYPTIAAVDNNWGHPSGATVASDVTSGTWPHGDEHYFFRDSNNHVQEQYSWGYSDWGTAPTGWTFIQAPSAAGWGEQRWDFFSTAINSSSQATLIHWAWDDGTTYSMHSFGYPVVSGCDIVSGPTVVGSDIGRLDVFINAWCTGLTPAVLHGYCTTTSDCNSNTFTWRTLDTG